jgi:hypothetical protein
MLKTVSSITNAIGALNFKGTWNASTNTPTIVSSVGVKGDYFVVAVAGSTTIDGISNWGLGDWITYNGSVWQRVEGGADLNGVNLSVSGTTTLSGLTASTALALNASKEAVSVTNTGTGNNVLADGPTMTTPTLGVASATSINKVVLTAPATGSTLTIADGKTLTANQSLTLAGTDATTMTFPTTSATIARTDAAQTFSGNQTFSGDVLLNTGPAPAETTPGQIAGNEMLILAKTAGVAANGTVDLTINTDTYFGAPGGFVGILNVASSRLNFTPQSRRTVFAVAAYGTTLDITTLETQDGSGGSSTFTITMPSNGVVRFTDTSGQDVSVRISFIGSKSLT